jgi:phosphosulfolactate phosphohydrolase-like enzyme
VTNGTIPLKHTGDMHILTSDLVNVFKNADVLRTLADHQLVAMQSAIGAEIDRRKNSGHR